MSEYQFLYVFCDRCFPDQLPTVPVLYPGSPVKGVYWGPATDAMAEGWQEVDYGHICPECVVEDGQEVAEGDNMVLGKGAWGTALEPMYETEEEVDKADPLDRGVSN